MRQMQGANCPGHTRWGGVAGQAQQRAAAMGRHTGKSRQQANPHLVGVYIGFFIGWKDLKGWSSKLLILQAPYTNIRTYFAKSNFINQFRWGRRFLGRRKFLGAPALFETLLLFFICLFCVCAIMLVCGMLTFCLIYSMMENTSMCMYICDRLWEKGAFGAITKLEI